MTPDADTPEIADVTADSFRFGPQQEDALKLVRDWLGGLSRGTERRQVFKLFGYAGTGKTTLARHLAAEVDGAVFFAAFTGKAALMMQKNGCAGASTLHRLIYTARRTASGGVVFKLNTDSVIRGAKLLVIDECSMVDASMAHDILGFGIPVLVLGDPAQLPPVMGKGFFTAGQPDAMLTEIHRQAAGNPIIRIATDVREGRDIAYGRHGDTVIVDRPGRRDPEDVLQANQVIVGRNDTRRSFNARLRQHLGFTEATPHVGDRLVCLRNDPEAQILNGELFSVTGYRDTEREDFVGLDVLSEDAGHERPTGVLVHRTFFDPEGPDENIDWKILSGTQQFDYGYALTAHKAQGSQWDHVLAYDEGQVFRQDARRWLYTVITRAAERLTLIR